MKSIYNLLFPVFCVGCGRSGHPICDTCLGQIELLKNQYCPTCKHYNILGEFCSHSCGKGYYFDRLFACTDFTPDSIAIKTLKEIKYKLHPHFAEALSGLLFKQFRLFSSFFRDNLLITFVPSDDKRFKERGFNQSQMLAGLLSKSFGFRIHDLLQRKDRSLQQAKLSRDERRKNLTGSIMLKPGVKHFIQDKHIVLVDDIATTCSTLNECSRVLKQNQVKEISAFVLARSWRR